MTRYEHKVICSSHWNPGGILWVRTSIATSDVWLPSFFFFNPLKSSFAFRGRLHAIQA